MGSTLTIDLKSRRCREFMQLVPDAAVFDSAGDSGVKENRVSTFQKINFE